MVVSPDVKGGTNELAETTVRSAPGSAVVPSDVGECPGENDPYAGARSWVAKWFGPFFNVQTLPLQSSMGLYLLYVGNYPLFFSSSAGIMAALSRHLIFSGHQAVPIDLLGREILHYVGVYRQPLSLKTALLFQDNKLIHPKEYLYCYRRAAAALAYSHSTPCNKYARLQYEFEPLTLTNLGKSFPLKASFHVEPETLKDEPTANEAPKNASSKGEKKRKLRGEQDE